MPVYEDPRDIRPDQAQEVYPFGERCLNKRGHLPHEWELTTPDGVLVLSCKGHTYCGKTGFIDSEEDQYRTTCGRVLDHDDRCVDDIWGEFTPVD